MADGAYERHEPREAELKRFQRILDAHKHDQAVFDRKTDKKV